MGKYEEFVRDVATRTRTNLFYIEAAEKRGEEVYETTQLINSLLGMLVFVQQTESLPSTQLSELPGFPELEFVRGEKRTRNFSSFVEFCRHAIAHGHVEPEANGENDKITHLVLKNRLNDSTPFIWIVRCSVEDIRGIALYIVKYIANEPD